MGPLRSLLAQTGVASFEWYEGTIATEAGPGVSVMFEGPYYQYFSWPPTASEDDELSIREACEDLEDHIEENGPYDAILGFSQGSTLLAEFLCDYT
jgi:predicted esterase